jgi:Ca2+-transporting ATPase
MKYVRFQIVALTGFILLFVLAGIFNVAEGIPLTPLQILWVNFAIDVMLAVGLGFDAATPGIMERKPRPADAPILTRALGTRLITGGLIMAVATLIVVAIGEDQYALPVALTMGLVTLSLLHIVAAVSTRAPERHIFSLNTISNSRFIILILASVILTLLVTEISLLQRMFDTVALTSEQWGICLLATGIVMIALELSKVLLNRTGWASVSATAVEREESPTPMVPGTQPAS